MSKILPKVPLVDAETGALSREWVHLYSKENNCDVFTAFGVGIRLFADLAAKMTEFQTKFLDDSYGTIRDYEAFSAGARCFETLKETPNKNARTIPVIVQEDP